HDVPYRTDSAARLYVVRGAGARLAVHAGAGAVVTRAVERALDVVDETAPQLRLVLDGVLRGPERRSVFLVVHVPGDAGRGPQAADDGPRVMQVHGAHDEPPEEEGPAPEEPQVNGLDEPHVDGNPPTVNGAHQVHIDAA
ncbi:hypothetical protein TCAP_04059, partial [Tolypocladium capitatum]